MRKREDQLITTPEATDTSRAWVYTSFSALLILHPHQHGSMTVTSLRADDEVLDHVEVFACLATGQAQRMIRQSGLRHQMCPAGSSSTAMHKTSGR